jgi:hypothetical protein
LRNAWAKPATNLIWGDYSVEAIRPSQNASVGSEARSRNLTLAHPPAPRRPSYDDRSDRAKLRFRRQVEASLLASEGASIRGSSRRPVATIRNTTDNNPIISTVLSATRPLSNIGRGSLLLRQRFQRRGRWCLGRPATATGGAPRIVVGTRAFEDVVNALGTPLEGMSDSLRPIGDGVARSVSASLNCVTGIMQPIPDARFRCGHGTVGMCGRTHKLTNHQ